MLWSKAISNGLYGAVRATRAHSSSSPICTNRLIVDKGGFFHLVLSEYANQSHNFKNVNFSPLYGKQDVNTKIWDQLRALGCIIKEATYYHWNQSMHIGTICCKIWCETEILKSKLYYAESYRLFSAASARRALFFLNSSPLGDDTLWCIICDSNLWFLSNKYKSRAKQLL